MNTTLMATRNAAGLPGRPERCTEFQLHSKAANVVDFTERKLLKLAAKVSDPQQKLTLVAVIQDYRDGNIAVAWKRGAPVYVRVTKEA
jgi:hypothetical protein